MCVKAGLRVIWSRYVRTGQWEPELSPADDNAKVPDPKLSHSVVSHQSSAWLGVEADPDVVRELVPRRAGRLPRALSCGAVTCRKCRVPMKEVKSHIFHKQRKWKCPKCAKVRMQQQR
jgi:hypothetical protein